MEAVGKLFGQRVGCLGSLSDKNQKIIIIVFRITGLNKEKWIRIKRWTEIQNVCGNSY